MVGLKADLSEIASDDTDFMILKYYNSRGVPT
jgi:hypothetical protein